MAEHFNADFLAAAPPDQVREILSGLGAVAVREVRSSTATELEVVVVAADGTTLVTNLAVEAAEPHRVLLLLFTPADDSSPATSWEEIDEGLDALARVSFLAAEVGDDDTLVPVHERDPDSAGPLGSAFKLYVLGALVEAVAGGAIGWDDVLTIDAADRSLPSVALPGRPS